LQFFDKFPTPEIMVAHIFNFAAELPENERFLAQYFVFFGPKNFEEK